MSSDPPGKRIADQGADRGAHGDRGRAAAENIDPTTTGAARIIGWYDNEWGFSTRLIDMVKRMG